MSLEVRAANRQIAVNHEQPANEPRARRGWLEYESVEEAFYVWGSVAQIVGGIASLCVGNPGPAVIMFISSGLHLQGAENSRRVNRMIEIEASSVRLQGSVQRLEQENANLAAQVQRVSQVANQLEQQNANLNARNAELTALIQNGDQTLRARFEEFSALRERMAAAQARFEASVRSLEQNERLATAAQTRLDVSTERLQDSERQIAENTTRLTEQTRLLAQQTQQTRQYLASLGNPNTRPATPSQSSDPSAPSMIEIRV